MHIQRKDLSHEAVDINLTEENKQYTLKRPRIANALNGCFVNPDKTNVL